MKSTCPKCGRKKSLTTKFWYPHRLTNSGFMLSACKECISNSKKKVKTAVVCIECGDTFNGIEGYNKYCTRKCSDNAQRKKMVQRQRNGTYFIVSKCKECGKKFNDPRFGRVKLYCSEECIKANRKKKHPWRFTYRQCKNCGGEFLPKTSQSRNNRGYSGTYCSRACFFEYKKENKKQKKTAPFPPGSERQCIVCKEIFIVERHKEKSLTCGRQCAVKYRSEYARNRNKTNYYKNNRETRICLYCGTSFVREYNDHNISYCRNCRSHKWIHKIRYKEKVKNDLSDSYIRTLIRQHGEHGENITDEKIKLRRNALIIRREVKKLIATARMAEEKLNIKTSFVKKIRRAKHEPDFNDVRLQQRENEQDHGKRL